MHPYNKEFIRLMKKAGWNKAETARQLEITPAVITRYTYGETRPSLTTLKLFKVILGDNRPMPEDDYDKLLAELGANPLAEYEQELLDCLRQLPPKKASPLADELTKLAEIGRRKGD